MKHDSLMIYMFTTKLFAVMKDVGEIAIVRESDLNHDVLFNKMGFYDKNDYLSHYPGEFSDESRVYNIYVGEDNNTHLNQDQKDMFIINALRHKISCEFLNGYMNILPVMFIIPTTEDVAKCEDVSKIDYEELWFCEDW